MILPFFIFNLFMYQNMFLPFFQAISHQSNVVYSIINGSVVSHVHNIFYYIFELLKQNLLFLLGFFYVKSKKKVLIPFLLFIVYFTCIINKQPRFMLVFLPYLSIMAGYGFYYLLSKRYKFLVVVSVILLVVPSLVLISTQYSWRNSHVPEINLLYTFFNDKQGSVLTMFPVPTAYSDIKLIPFYNNVEDAINIYEKQKNNIDYILYSDEFYPCFDNKCYEIREGLFKSINNNHLIFNLSYGQNYYVYES